MSTTHITQTATRNRLQELEAMGQAIWLDFISRDLIIRGELKRLIQEDGLSGITSNPSIFEKAVSSSHDYDDILSAGSAEKRSAKEIYEQLVIRDIQDAADMLRPVYNSTNRLDGYVSLEVSPHLARDTEGTMEEARRLWQAVNRPNIFIKVPGSPEGAPAVRQLTSEGLNINITLLFSQENYHAVAEAYVAGLEERAARGEDLSGVASVASFFVSRIDTLVDKKIDEQAKQAGAAEQKQLKALQGKVAIANAKQAYRWYQQFFATERWKKLAAKGARTQRLLWASTSTKNPAYRDVLYVEELIGPETVNTLPLATIEAFLDHGKVARTLDKDLSHADAVMQELAVVGISMREVTDELLEQAIVLFNGSFDKLLAAIEGKK